ncbi:MAG: 16S rRNA (adenine(1518)-N(6)/adenine(1519)-N(6))-dimethyltransferase RsmA [Candidatus Acidiferrales bacterium]
MRARRHTERTGQQRRPPLGQHFIADAHLREKIFGLLRGRAQDCWLEIGAGHGEMTVALAAASRAVTAVERDPKLAETLRERLGGLPGARVVEADILAVSPANLVKEISCPRLRVYGSLPFYITSPILRHLFAALEAIEDIHVVVQHEVAQRLAAHPGGRDYGYLSVLTQFHATPEVLLHIPRGAFRPVPQVDSALVRLTPPGKQPALGVASREEFLRFVSTCFRQKRKTLRNNLATWLPVAAIEKALVEMGLDVRARAEELGIEDFARVFGTLRQPGTLVVGREAP